MVNFQHISDDGLESYNLGLVHDDELIQLEEHLPSCPDCARRAEESVIYIHAMRIASVTGNSDQVSDATYYAEQEDPSADSKM